MPKEPETTPVGGADAGDGLAPEAARPSPGSSATNLIALLVPAAAIGAIYWPTAVELIKLWGTDPKRLGPAQPDFSHGYAVPVLSLVIAYVAWTRHGPLVQAKATTKEIFLGLFEIALGLVVHVAAWFIGSLFFDVASLILVLRGSMLLLGGTAGVRAYGFAALFLIFMAPLPASWYQPIAIAMQQVVSAISTWFLELCGTPVFREGYMIHIPGYTMEVGEACSGLRQLTAILALTVCIAYFSRRGRFYTWTLVLGSVPIAIAANCFRVMLTGVIMMLLGKEWADGVFHSLEGLVIVAMAAVLVLGLAWGLARLEDRLGLRIEKTDGNGARLAGAEQH